MIKKYQLYIANIFIRNLIFISLIFLSLSFILNFFEELKFFENYEVGLKYPILLTFILLPGIYSLSFYLFHYPIIIISRIITESYFLDESHNLFFTVFATFIVSLSSAYFLEFKLYGFLILNKIKKLYYFSFIFLGAFFQYLNYRYVNSIWIKVVGNNQYSYSSDCDRDFFNKKIKKTTEPDLSNHQI